MYSALTTAPHFKVCDGHPSRQPLSHVNNFSAVGTATSKTPVCMPTSSALERTYSIPVHIIFHMGITSMNVHIDPGDWHLHGLLAQLTACIDTKPAEKPPTFYGTYETVRIIISDNHVSLISHR